MCIRDRQCYALQTVLIEMGHDIEIIDRLFDKFNIPSYRFKRVKKVIFPNYFERFREKFLKLSEHINSQQDLYDIQNRYDVIITGSDQIWNFDCIKKMGYYYCLLYTSPSPRDGATSRMPSSA